MLTVDEVRRRLLTALEEDPAASHITLVRKIVAGESDYAIDFPVLLEDLTRGKESKLGL